ncbi:MAG: hypothetical protein RMN25_14050 [Anaerolineae bacterium]|nr:hypothetical protein [Thermoflexales bacterium]MDW8408894.1 hypothetical protein [Anaerolineae bacterium]
MLKKACWQIGAAGRIDRRCMARATPARGAVGLVVFSALLLGCVSSAPQAGVRVGVYGRHHPNGAAAVDYLYSADGMWKRMDPIEYTVNFYDRPDNPPAHPANKQALIAYADGTRFTTARDANGHLLLDADHDGQLDTAHGGFAFHEHNGIGLGGEPRATPFTNFWFDDNWLARYVSRAYGRPEPDGLSEPAGFVRWRVVGGDTTHWNTYGADYFDTLALDGLYYLARNDTARALRQWERMLGKSLYRYDHAQRRYRYPAIPENYYYGLFQILTSFLMDSPELPLDKRNEIFQHWVSLRSAILDHQERRGDVLLGWRTSINDPTSLINTETTAANVLALGAGALDTFEAGQAPLTVKANGYIRQTPHVLSAVVGATRPGLLIDGPSWPYAPGRYRVEFVLRAKAPRGQLATVEVYDPRAQRALVNRQVTSTDFSAADAWVRVVLFVNLTNADSHLDFRLRWHGEDDLDVACIRVVRP